MSLWPGHLHPSISERKGDISMCSLDPNPVPSWLIRSGLFRSIANIFLSEVERGAGDSFWASAMVTRLMRDGLSVDRQAEHVAGFTGHGLLTSSATSPHWSLLKNGQFI